MTAIQTPPTPTAAAATGGSAPEPPPRRAGWNPLTRGAAMIGALALVLLVGGLVLKWKLPGHLPVSALVSVLSQSMIFGCLDALIAVGIVVIYRASRVINFAHGGIWVVSYTLFWELAGFHGVSWYLAFPAAVLAGGVVGAVIELVFIRRFFGAARLIVAVVLIGIAQLLSAFAQSLPGMLGDHDKRPGRVTTPFS